MDALKKLKLACALLAGSMVPLLVEATWRGFRLSEPVVWFIALVTCGLALWGAYQGRVAWVINLIRAIVQLLVMLAVIQSTHTYNSRGVTQLFQCWLSFGLAASSLWLLLHQPVRALVFAPKITADGQPAAAPREPSRLRSPRIPIALTLVAAVLGFVEQRWLYQHLSALEVLLRSLYILLPWLGAWQCARLSKDRALLIMLGTFLGDVLGEVVSIVCSGGNMANILRLLSFPMGNLATLLVGLAIGLLAPKRPLWLLGSILPLTSVLARTINQFLTSRGSLPNTPQLVLALIGGIACAAVFYLFRSAAKSAES